MTCAFADLPAELLCQIVAHIDTVRPLSHLSQTCRKIHTFVNHDGFRVFVQSRFPYFKPSSIHPPSFWRDAAHGLTTLSRNWDRKAFLAWNIYPRVRDSQMHREQRGYFRSGQTMGFVPVIDSYDSWHGGDWGSRKEVVAWGAGAQLVMRIKVMGGRVEDRRESESDKAQTDFNAQKHRIRWTKYIETGTVEGKDDITSVNLLPQPHLDSPEQVVIGRASGRLCLLGLQDDCRGGNGELLVEYDTGRRPVRSATMSKGSNAMLAACLSDSTIALFPLDSTDTQVSVTGESLAFPAGRPGKTWASQFLNHSRLAVAFGPAKEPIRIYDIGQGELTAETSRSLALSDMHPEPNNSDMIPSSSTSVYSLAAIPTSSSIGGTEGQVFLSGAYDGLTRLHDLRMQKSTVAIFQDPVDTFSPIYDLLPIGTERFVAGGGRHSIIKIFDFRIPGSKLYHATDLDPCSTRSNNGPKKSTRPTQSQCCNFHHDSRHNPRDWNVFLRVQASRNRQDSPVYSLSRPSQASPSLFAGLENHIIQLDMVSIMDKHPDPLHIRGPSEQRNTDDVRRNWDPHGEVLSLPAYEHTSQAVLLKKQRARLEYCQQSHRPGWDERWLPDPH